MFFGQCEIDLCVSFLPLSHAHCNYSDYLRYQYLFNKLYQFSGIKKS